VVSADVLEGVEHPFGTNRPRHDKRHRKEVLFEVIFLSTTAMQEKN
jgi:hypothetical protein